MSGRVVMPMSMEDIVHGGGRVSAVLLGREQGAWDAAEDTAVLGTTGQLGRLARAATFVSGTSKTLRESRATGEGTCAVSNGGM